LKTACLSLIRRPAIAALLLAAVTSSAAAQTISQGEAGKTLEKVLAFYRGNVGYEGAYLWKYAADLSAQEGEEMATKTSGWTQPPGAPSVGEAFLKAWRLSGEEQCRTAAIEVALALVRAQLESGGWSSHFDLGPEGRKKYRYRVNEKQTGRSNSTTFDDNKTQSALLLLMHVDEELTFQNADIHEAVEYALQQILKAQYPNGAWPQQFSETLDHSQFPVKRASYPEEWPQTFPKKKYTGHYTLNDGNMSHLIDMLFEAHRIYNRSDCYGAAVRTAEFFLLAQMPDPQPGWAQQYDSDMHPVWARKFEPPAITGGEAQGVMNKLIDVYRITGDKKFLAPLPRAISYYRKSVLNDGQLARFYELQTNRPLFFTREYELTYHDADVPTHYAFKVGSKLDSIERTYEAALNTPLRNLKPQHVSVTPEKLSSKIAKRAAEIVQSLDERGAWVEDGKMEHQGASLKVIDMKTFARNLETLARFVGAVP